MAWGQKPWIVFLVLPLTSCVNFRKPYKQSEPPTLHPCLRNDATCLTAMWRGSNE